MNSRPIDMLAVFSSIDTNCDGVVSREELARFLRAGDETWSEEQIGQAFRAADVDGNQGIDFDEFLVLLARIDGPSPW